MSDREYEFGLVLTGITELTEAVANALFESGCDDALFSVRCGRAFATFSRSAPSAKDAILSAIQNIRQAGIGADVLRIDECNLITQAEIGRKIQRSRQLVHQYITGARGPGGFPPPACHINDESPLWYWCEVATWLWENNMIKEEERREADEIAYINTLLELQSQQQLHPELADEINRSIAVTR